ncbi:MAG: ribonuclease P protein component [Herpetosiphon sp.]
MRRDGKTLAHPFLLLNVARNRTGHTRYGFVVGKKLGKAHDRNRAKRRVSEAVRLQRQAILPGWDVVFVIRTPVLAARFEEVQRVVRDTLKRAKLLVETEQQGNKHATPDRTGIDTPVPTLFPADATELHL